MSTMYRTGIYPTFILIILTVFAGQTLTNSFPGFPKNFPGMLPESEMNQLMAHMNSTTPIPEDNRRQLKNSPNCPIQNFTACFDEIYEAVNSTYSNLNKVQLMLHPFKKNVSILNKCSALASLDLTTIQQCANNTVKKCPKEAPLSHIARTRNVSIISNFLQEYCSEGCNQAVKRVELMKQKRQSLHKLLKTAVDSDTEQFCRDVQLHLDGEARQANACSGLEANVTQLFNYLNSNPPTSNCSLILRYDFPSTEQEQDAPSNIQEEFNIFGEGSSGKNQVIKHVDLGLPPEAFTVGSGPTSGGAIPVILMASHFAVMIQQM